MEQIYTIAEDSFEPIIGQIRRLFDKAIKSFSVELFESCQNINIEFPLS